MNSDTLVFLWACGKPASFFRLPSEPWTDLCEIFEMHLTLLDTVVYPTSLLFISLASLPTPKVSWYYLAPCFLHLFFVDSFHILSLFLPAVIFWESPLSSTVFASVGGDCFFRSLGEISNIWSKESGLWANSMSKVAVHPATTLPNNFWYCFVKIVALGSLRWQHMQPQQKSGICCAGTGITGQPACWALF